MRARGNIWGAREGSEKEKIRKSDAKQSRQKWGLTATVLSGVDGRDQIFLIGYVFDYKISILISVTPYLKV